MKEVQEETGIECEPVRLIAVLDGLRLGFTRIPLYSLVFHCRAIGGELQRHPLECADVGWFAEDDLPEPLAGAGLGRRLAFAAIRGRASTCSSTRPATHPGEAETARGRALRRRAGRGGRRRSTSASGSLPLVADGARGRPARASGATPSASVHGRRQRRRLDLVAVGRERLEAVPQRLGRRRRRRRRCPGRGRRAGTARRCRRRLAGRTRPPGGAATRGSCRRARRRAARSGSRSRRRRPARRSARRGRRSPPGRTRQTQAGDRPATVRTLGSTVPVRGTSA